MARKVKLQTLQEQTENKLLKPLKTFSVFIDSQGPDVPVVFAANHCEFSEHPGGVAFYILREGEERYLETVAVFARFNYFTVEPLDPSILS